MNDQLDELYRDIIMDHYRTPRGKVAVETPDVHNEGKNPSCGDEVEVDLKLADGVVEKVGVSCIGCAISTASASILAELVEGRPIEDVKKIAEIVKALLTTDVDLPEDADYGDLEALKGVKQFPVRIKCALLAWVTMIEGIEAYEKGETTKGVTTE
jgi:nitrogen fixation NifU-like protein